MGRCRAPSTDATLQVTPAVLLAQTKEGATDELFVRATTPARETTGNLMDSAHDELFSDAGLEEDLFDALAKDVSNRQKKSDLDDVFGEMK